MILTRAGVPATLVRELLLFYDGLDVGAVDAGGGGGETKKCKRLFPSGGGETPYLQRVQTLFDPERVGAVRFRCFVRALAKLASPRPQCPGETYFAFRFFDADDDGGVSKKEYREALEAAEAHFGGGRVRSTKPKPRSLDRYDAYALDAPSTPSRRGGGYFNGARCNANARDATATRMFDAYDRDRDGALSLRRVLVVTLVPIRPRWRGERRSLRTFAGVSLFPPLAFDHRPRRLTTPSDAPPNSPPDVASYGQSPSASSRARTRRRAARSRLSRSCTRRFVRTSSPRTS